MQILTICRVLAKLQKETKNGITLAWKNGPTVEKFGNNFFYIKPVHVLVILGSMEDFLKPTN